MQAVPYTNFRQYTLLEKIAYHKKRIPLLWGKKKADAIINLEHLEKLAANRRLANLSKAEELALRLKQIKLRKEQQALDRIVATALWSVVKPALKPELMPPKKKKQYRNIGPKMEVDIDEKIRYYSELSKDQSLTKKQRDSAKQSMRRKIAYKHKTEKVPLSSLITVTEPAALLMYKDGNAYEQLKDFSWPEIKEIYRNSVVPISDNVMDNLYILKFGAAKFAELLAQRNDLLEYLDKILPNGKPARK